TGIWWPTCGPPRRCWQRRWREAGGAFGSAPAKAIDQRPGLDPQTHGSPAGLSRASIILREKLLRRRWTAGPSPAMTRLGRRALFLFREAPAHERGQRGDDLSRLPPARLDGDRRPGTGRKHHQSHDRGSADDLMSALDFHLGVELLHRLHELRRGARVQPFFIADLQHAGNGRRVRRIMAGRKLAGRFGHLPGRTRLAMVMYLRPESWAAATASVSGHSSLTLASFTSIGRLMPARTSTFGRPMTEMARLEGVPPNMSVRMATPSPLSTRLTASMMSLRLCRRPRSGPMVAASICLCGPPPCSRAERTPAARRPCVTSTRPIIESPAGTSGLRRTKGRPSSRS